MKTLVLALDHSHSLVTQSPPELRYLPTDLRTLAIQCVESNPMFRGRLAQGVIQIESYGDSIVLTGKVPSYYVKQLLQETLRRVDGVTQIKNHVVVVNARELTATNAGER